MSCTKRVISPPRSCCETKLTLSMNAEYDNSSGVGEAEQFALRYVWSAFKDWQVWVHILVYMSIVGPRELAHPLQYVLLLIRISCQFTAYHFSCRKSPLYLCKLEADIIAAQLVLSSQSKHS